MVFPRCLLASTILLSSAASLGTSTASLSKKSTSLDVIKYLKDSKQLASYTEKSRGATALVTGGSSGIGENCVETLALAGLNVILAARDVDAAKRVIAGSNFKDQITVQELDLSDLNSVKRCADAIEGNIDILVNNAGVMALPKRETSAQGFELQMGVNHVGHHMLTRLLLPKMNKGGRVVTLASTAHTMSDIDFDDLNFEKKRKYTPWGSYGQSKLANILFAKGLDDRLKGTKSDILSVSVHPGVIKTKLWRHQNPIFRAVSGVMMDKNIEQGAATSVYCSLIEPKAFEGGEYVMDCKVTDPNDNGQDRDGALRNKLWDRTEKMIADAGFDLPKELL